MKTVTLKNNNVHRRHTQAAGKSAFMFLVFFLVVLYSFSQTSAYLDFRNPIAESGTPGADGSQYRFLNVTTNVDAIVTITRRSDGLVNMLNIDMNTSGFDGAFQPQVGYNNGTTPGAADWWMEFNIQFVNAGTTTPVVVSEFNVSGVDIDGNGQYINEYLSFFDMQDYSIESTSGLIVSPLNEDINGTMTSGRRFDGPVANFVNIDTSATTVMVSNHYVNKSSFTVRTGGHSTDVSGAADRMYSLYFQNFAYGTPVNSTLAIQRNTRRTPERKEQVKAMTMYPNPAMNVVNISLPSADDRSMLLSIYDSRGSLMRRSALPPDNKINVLDLRPGVYFFHVQSGSDTTITRILKM